MYSNRVVLTNYGGSMPILIAPINQELTIKRVSSNDKVRRHLESLGIVPERKIKILEQTSNGIIVLVNDMRLALDKDVAMTIFVA